MDVASNDGVTAAHGSAHVSLVTLGVQDVERSTRFYEAIGWQRSRASTAEVSFLRGGAVALALLGRDDLAAEAQTEPLALGPAPVALATNLASEAEVDAWIAMVRAAGGEVVAPASRAEWGGYSGYVSDPDGHLWEVAHNPGFPLTPDGRVALPDLPPDVVRIVSAGPSDAGELLTVQRAAYVTEAQSHEDPHLPPLRQTLDDLTAELREAVALKATIGVRTVGGVRARIEDRTAHIGRLTVAPDVQGHGIGRGLMAAIERRVGDSVDRYELFTGARSAANLRFYERLGYRPIRRERLPDGPTVVVLDKRRRG